MANNALPAGVSANYVPQFISGGQEPSYMDLTPGEIQLFNSALAATAEIVTYDSDTALANLILKERDNYLFAAAVAKQQFNGKTFGGLLGQTGFNIQAIRAATILTQASASAVYPWDQNFTTKGWQALFGSQASPFTVGTTGTATYIGTTYQRVMFLATHLIDTVPFKFEEIRLGVSKISYPVQVLHVNKISNVYVAKLAAPLLVTINQQFFIEANVQYLGGDVPALFGMQYVTSDYAVIE